MLAQNFKPAADLGITDLEQSALIKVLGMLERGELVNMGEFARGPNGFNMSTPGHGCGTPACIGGWAAFLMDEDQVKYVERYGWSHRSDNPALHDLFWNEGAVELDKGATTSQAATALRSYLTTGDARWDLALMD